MSKRRLYRQHKERAWELEPELSAHRSAMTSEALHSKAEIAEELAVRDRKLSEETEKLLASLDTMSREERNELHIDILTEMQRRADDRVADLERQLALLTVQLEDATADKLEAVRDGSALRRQLAAVTAERDAARGKLEEAHDLLGAAGIRADTTPGRVRLIITDRDAACAALQKVSDIRDSIIGAQSINWSEHIYPLVAVLDAAGFPGAGYESGRENLGTLVEQRDAARAGVARLLDVARPLAHMGLSGVLHDHARAGDLLGRLAEAVAAVGSGQEKDDAQQPLEQCDHPWHRNPGLCTPCPECGEGRDEDDG